MIISVILMVILMIMLIAFSVVVSPWIIYVLTLTMLYIPMLTVQSKDRSKTNILLAINIL
ncbi:protein of unknown function [Candidatus Nitrosocaldus cavascurensis]|jgi:uncharacterized membrane protein|uniref:Uncharacterized protein n=1 Tax=Candidatus Nitrosocaldus cavascurensis TaxID=2058097 RepID=A0A2K5AS80_9ARCH|nr:protein of unknown function [Candidatus Nitrosocaldus cavascurensis]